VDHLAHLQNFCEHKGCEYVGNVAKMAITADVRCVNNAKKEITMSVYKKKLNGQDKQEVHRMWQ
jgi:hypothetical protein